MAILVTGGAGFIGRNLVRHLINSTDEDIHILDIAPRPNFFNARIEYHKGDIRKLKEMKDYAYDRYDGLFYDVSRIYHLSSIVGVELNAENPLLSMDITATGIKNLVECYPNVDRILFTSTSGIYGNKSEQQEIDARQTYSLAKLFAERYLMLDPKLRPE